MNQFEAYIIPGGEVEVQDHQGHTFTIESERGLMFAAELVSELRLQHPTMLLAVEQKIKRNNKQLFAMMKQSHRIYLSQVAHTVCSCCFGERDEVPDFDGIRFRMERPNGCREAKYCPWNGYAERNKDSFMCICGAKREYHFTPQERQIVLLAKKGFVNPAIIAEALGLAQKTVWTHLTDIYRKTGTDGMPALINRIAYENV